MGEQKFHKNFPESIYSINDNPLDTLTRAAVRLETQLEEVEKGLKEGERLLADEMEVNKIGRDLGYEPDDLSDLQKMIVKIKKSIIITRDVIKQYEIQMEALKKGDRHLEQAFRKQLGEKNRPSA